METELNGYLVHDAVLMLVDALKRAGKPDGEAIAKALETTDVKGITGRIKISPQTHNPEGKDAAIIKIVNGEVHVPAEVRRQVSGDPEGAPVDGGRQPSWTRPVPPGRVPYRKPDGQSPDPECL